MGVVVGFKTLEITEITNFKTPPNGAHTVDCDGGDG